MVGAVSCNKPGVSGQLPLELDLAHVDRGADPRCLGGVHGAERLGARLHVLFRREVLEDQRRPLGFVDPMEITLWQPPRACHVVHTGSVVRGTGVFEVEPRGDNRSRFHWREDLDLPLGLLGRIGWPLVRPFFSYGVKTSLRRFARHVTEQRTSRLSGR